jgi:Uncharacterised protein family (UPF0259)
MTTRDEAEQGLTFRQIVRDSLGVYRRHWNFLVPVAAIILLPQALTDAFLDGKDVEGINSAKDAFILAAAPLTACVSLMGEAIYAGVTAAAVVEVLAGRPVPGPVALWRALPIGRLIAVDVILTLGFALGLVLLVIPGLVFLTYFAITPAILKFEHTGIRDAFRRSARLVRPHFWTVMRIVVLVIILSELAMQAIAAPFHGLALVTVVDLVGEAILQPFPGLVTVLVAIRLLELRGELPPREELTVGRVPA